MSKKQSRRTRRFARKLANRCITLLESGKWRVMYIDMDGRPEVCLPYGLDHKAVGTCDYAKKTLFIDFRRDVISTLVHELLHARFPDWPESLVAEREKTVMEYLSPRQARKLHLAMGRWLAVPGE